VDAGDRETLAENWKLREGGGVCRCLRSDTPLRGYSGGCVDKMAVMVIVLIV
jgi:hypothetical protein